MLWPVSRPKIGPVMRRQLILLRWLLILLAGFVNRRQARDSLSLLLLWTSISLRNVSQHIGMLGCSRQPRVG